MENTLDLGQNRRLQAEAEALLERYLRPSYLTTDEHLAVSANEQGEVWLSGLVHDSRLAQEAIRLVKTLAGVTVVFNYVTMMQDGNPTNL